MKHNKKKFVSTMLIFVVGYISVAVYLSHEINDKDQAINAKERDIKNIQQELNLKNQEISKLKSKNKQLNNQLAEIITETSKTNEKLSKDIQLKMSEINSKLDSLYKKRILTESDIDALERIVEAEASTQGLKGKVLVASVVLNRWLAANDKSVDEIVKAPRQFDPVDNGKYYSVKPTDETKQAVAMAIERDYSEGSRFFMNPEISSRGNVNWFRKALRLKIKHKDHEFFAPK